MAFWRSEPEAYYGNHGKEIFNMELLRGSALFSYLLDKYSKNPSGWFFTVGPSPRDNFFDGIVSGPEESWQLKMDSIFKPTPIVLGAKVDAPPTHLPNLPSYGYRKLEPEVLLNLFKQASEDSLPAEAIEKLLHSLKPVAPVQKGSYAEGPVVFTNKKILGVSKTQKQLDEKLASEVKKLLRQSYPSYG
jgi:hypothetical protein